MSIVVTSGSLLTGRHKWRVNMANQPVDAVRGVYRSYNSSHMYQFKAAIKPTARGPRRQSRWADRDSLLQQFAYIRPHYWRRSGAVLPFRPAVSRICTGLRGWEWRRSTLQLRALFLSL